LGRIVQPALDKLYSLLNDEQKARLNAFVEHQRRRSSAYGKRLKIDKGINSVRAPMPGRYL
jgi:hypothetical protein